MHMDLRNMDTQKSCPHQLQLSLKNINLQIYEFKDHIQVKHIKIVQNYSTIKVHYYSIKVWHSVITSGNQLSFRNYSKIKKSEI